ncbi:ankyrin repeat domain-containing protein [Sutcliffiella horikoshii]|uniref:ankyrin repeat domain-containing protein n=1 Tax=Sutcliffiella horikoshii TaxID=79883 RepID=UPI003CF5B439
MNTIKQQLDYVIKNNEVPKLIKLLQHHTYTKEQLNTALLSAVNMRDILKVKIFLDAGAEVSPSNLEPVIVSLDIADTELTVFFLHHLEKMDQLHHSYNTLLLTLSYVCRDISLLNYFLSLNMNINIKDEIGNTPLMLAIISCELEPGVQLLNFTKELVKAGADLNVQNDNGNTALMFACSLSGYLLDGDEELIHSINLLINHGAKVELSNHEGKTALDIAREEGFAEAIELLELHVKPNITPPNLQVAENNNATPNIYEYPDTSFLSKKGYHTKLSRSKRWNILIDEVLPEYPASVVIDKLASFIKRFKAQRNGAKKYENAIQEWEHDIQKLLNNRQIKS